MNLQIVQADLASLNKCVIQSANVDEFAIILSEVCGAGGGAKVLQWGSRPERCAGNKETNCMLSWEGSINMLTFR